ncbi:MAG: hypothetical protein JRJ37_10040, partial [Deltaproteobacteria bacterium]|nr:hypothetical protein [Deltaproteobacteria bacterium]
KDFQDAVELVLSAGAGFQVKDADERANTISAHMEDSRLYQKACRSAEELARSQQGSVQRQADMVMQLMAA